jgi:hypothetical protein
MDLLSAQRAVAATLLWHLRILAGWCPPLGAAPVRILAAGFEIANVVDHLSWLAGRAVPRPFALGSLSLAWPTMARTTSAAEVRTALARSVWGDPESDQIADVRAAMQFAWAARVADEVPAAAPFARDAVTLMLARFRAAGAEGGLRGGASRAVVRLVGARQRRSIPHLTDLPAEEVRWWRGVEQTSIHLTTRPRPDATTAVGVVGLLAADAWRTRAALAVAAAGGGDLEEVLGVPG